MHTQSKTEQQIIGIPMGTNCAPFLADKFLYSYEADFMQSLLSTGGKRLASQFNFTYRYIDDVLSINNPDFENYLGQMYGCTDRFHAIFHMPRSLKKVDVIYICFLLFYHIELYINKILSSCTFIIYRTKGFHSDHIYTGWP